MIMRSEMGFTRIELLAVTLVICFLLLASFSVLANNRTDSQSAACRNNLRQVGRAVLTWSGDHGERVPWWTPVAKGGTMSRSKAGNAWFEWLTFTNELPNPLVLACPADAGVQVASTFPEFASTRFRSAALSYVVGLHTFLDYPNSILSTDRNLRFTQAAGCSTGINNVNSMLTRDHACTKAVHDDFGHVLSIDGRVSVMNTEDLRNALDLPGSDQYGTEHFLKAR